MLRHQMGRGVTGGIWKGSFCHAQHVEPLLQGLARTQPKNNLAYREESPSQTRPGLD